VSDAAASCESHPSPRKGRDNTLSCVVVIVVTVVVVVVVASSFACADAALFSAIVTQCRAKTVVDIIIIIITVVVFVVVVVVVVASSCVCERQCLHLRRRDVAIVDASESFAWNTGHTRVTFSRRRYVRK
jgi:hypothetical protein